MANRWLFLSRANMVAAAAKSREEFWVALASATASSTNQAIPPALGPTPIADEYQRRATLLKSDDTAAHFFYEMDLATYFPLLEEKGDAKTSAALKSLAAYVGVRTLRRATYARYGLRFRGLPEDTVYAPAADQAQCILSRVFGRITKEGRIKTAVLNEFVRAFVTGDLQVQVGPTKPLNTHGAPNSSNFFAFAEFLFLLRDLRLSWDYWQNALRPFVTGAQVFAHLYWSGKGRSNSHYAWQWRKSNGSFTKDQWEALDSTINRIWAIHPSRLGRSLDFLIEEIFGDTVAHALRDETFTNPQCGLFLAAP